MLCATNPPKAGKLDTKKMAALLNCHIAEQQLINLTMQQLNNAFALSLVPASNWRGLDILIYKKFY